MSTVNERVSHRPGEKDSPAVEQVDGVWHLRGTMAVRAVLRERDATTQAGFTAEAVSSRMKDQPILFMDGEEHRRQRAKVASRPRSSARVTATSWSAGRRPWSPRWPLTGRAGSSRSPCATRSRWPPR